MRKTVVKIPTLVVTMKSDPHLIKMIRLYNRMAKRALDKEQMAVGKRQRARRRINKIYLLANDLT
jgi:hypothetical protein